jgi:phage FluMu protein Com
MIKFNCGSCGKIISVADAAVGKRGKCPQCKAVVQVPVPVAVVAEDEPYDLVERLSEVEWAATPAPTAPRGLMDSIRHSTTGERLPWFAAMSVGFLVVVVGLFLLVAWVTNPYVALALFLAVPLLVLFVVRKIKAPKVTQPLAGSTAGFSPSYAGGTVYPGPAAKKRKAETRGSGLSLTRVLLGVVIGIAGLIALARYGQQDDKKPVANTYAPNASAATTDLGSEFERVARERLPALVTAGDEAIKEAKAFLAGRPVEIGASTGTFISSEARPLEGGEHDAAGTLRYEVVGADGQREMKSAEFRRARSTKEWALYVDTGSMTVPQPAAPDPARAEEQFASFARKFCDSVPRRLNEAKFGGGGATFHLARNPRYAVTTEGGALVGTLTFDAGSATAFAVEGGQYAQFDLRFRPDERGWKYVGGQFRWTYGSWKSISAGDEAAMRRAATDAR